MIEPELKIKVIDKVKECKQLALVHLGLKLPPITIRFDLKGSIAGQANIEGWNCPRPWIRLNEWYLKEYPKDMLEETVPHEMAHIVADLHFKRECKHGMYWRHVMQRVYKLPPIVTHKFGPSITTRKFTFYIMYCPSCGYRFRFTDKLRNKIVQHGLAHYRCSNCKKNMAGATIILDID